MISYLDQIRLKRAVRQMKRAIRKTTRPIGGDWLHNHRMAERIILQNPPADPIQIKENEGLWDIHVWDIYNFDGANGDRYSVGAYKPLFCGFRSRERAEQFIAENDGNLIKQW